MHKRYITTRTFAACDGESFTAGDGGGAFSLSEMAVGSSPHRYPCHRYCGGAETSWQDAVVRTSAPSCSGRTRWHRRIPRHQNHHFYFACEKSCCRILTTVLARERPVRCRPVRCRRPAESWTAGKALRRPRPPPHRRRHRHCRRQDHQDATTDTGPASRRCRRQQWFDFRHRRQAQHLHARIGAHAFHHPPGADAN